MEMDPEEGFSPTSAHASSTSAAAVISARQRQQQAANINKVNLSEVRMQLQRQVKQQVRLEVERERADAIVTGQCSVLCCVVHTDMCATIGPLVQLKYLLMQAVTKAKLLPMTKELTQACWSCTDLHTS